MYYADCGSGLPELDDKWNTPNQQIKYASYVYYDFYLLNIAYTHAIKSTLKTITLVPESWYSLPAKSYE